MSDLPPVMTPEQLAELLNLRPRTIKEMRVTGRGPAFCRTGRDVVYLRADVLDWLAARRRRSTAEEDHSAIRAGVARRLAS